MSEYKTYDDIFLQAWQQVFAPKNALPQILQRKFEELGITLTEKQLAQISEQIEENKEPFYLEIDDEQYSGKDLLPDENGTFHLTIDLTDVAARLESLEAELPEWVGKLIPQMIQEWGKQTLQGLQENTSTILHEEAKDRGSFQVKLRAIWGEALDKLELLLVLATEAGSDLASEYRPNDQDKPDYKFQVLTGLHARACQIAKEVFTLLNAGFADGAHARWRSLHEVSVVAKFISEHDQELAERYLLHEWIESRKAATLHARYASRINEPAPTEGELRDLDEIYQSLLERFGKTFKDEYGWAASVFEHRNPSFADIERETSLDHFRPYYKLASHNVHANPKGMLFRLGSFPSADWLLAGPSIYGLADPGHGTAISLLGITTWLLTYQPTIDRGVRQQALSELEDQVGEAFLRAHWALEGNDNLKSES